MGRVPQWDTYPLPPDPRLYMVFFPRDSGSIGFPVKGCKGWVTTRTNLRIYFVHCHMRYMIVIMEKGNFPHLRFPACDIFVPWEALNHFHPTTALFARGADRKRRKLVEDEAWAVAYMEFQEYVRPLETVISFKYLGRLLTATDNYCPSVISNLHKVCKIWSRL